MLEAIKLQHELDCVISDLESSITLEMYKGKQVNCDIGWLEDNGLIVKPSQYVQFTANIKDGGDVHTHGEPRRKLVSEVMAAYKSTVKR